MRFIAIAIFVALLHLAGSASGGTVPLRTYERIEGARAVLGNQLVEECVDHSHDVRPWMILYIGPDLLLPFTSAIAAAVGVVLMFWHRLTGWIRGLWRMMFRRKE